MSKVYVLKYHYNAYDQLGGYVVAMWKDKPDFHKIKDWFETTSVSQLEDYSKYLHDWQYNVETIYGKLSRGEEVQESSLGGSSLKIVEVELL